MRNNGKKMDERYVDKWWKNGQFQGPTMATVKRNLGITTMKNIEWSNHIVKSLTAAFALIGRKTCSQDCNVARSVLAKSIVCRSTRQRHLLKCTSQIVPLHPKTLKKYSLRRDSLNGEGKMETLWEFSSRLLNWAHRFVYKHTTHKIAHTIYSAIEEWNNEKMVAIVNAFINQN